MTLPRCFPPKDSLWPFLASGLLLLPASGRDAISGTPDTDGDGDGDPVGDNYGFTIDSGITDTNGDLLLNRLGLSASHETEYWSSGQQATSWEDYAPSETTGSFAAAHVLEPLAPGSTYFYRQSFELGMSQFTMNWRETNGVLPTGTMMYVGYGNNGAPASPTVDPSISNLDDLGTTGFTTTAPSGFDTSLGTYAWFDYRVTEQGTQNTYEIKEASDTYSASDIIFLFEFPTTAEMKRNAERMPEANDWALSGYDKNGAFTSVTPGDDYWLTPEGNETAGGDPIPASVDDPTVDLVFSWTLDNKTDTWGDPNGNFVPEPTQTMMAILSLSLLALRRRRS